MRGTELHTDLAYKIKRFAILCAIIQNKKKVSCCKGFVMHQDELVLLPNKKKSQANIAQHYCAFQIGPKIITNGNPLPTSSNVKLLATMLCQCCQHQDKNRTFDIYKHKWVLGHIMPIQLEYHTERKIAPGLYRIIASERARKQL